MARGEETTVAGEWRRSWVVPLTAALGYSAASLQSYGFGPFVAPIEAEFGWSRAQVMSGLTVTGIAGLLFSFFVGMAIDRFGPRRVGLLGVTLKCGAFALLATATGSLLNWSLLWVILSMGMLFVQANVWTNAVASRFDKGRGFAIATALAGSSMTAIFAPLLAAYLMVDHGWRFAMAGVGIIWLVVTLPPVFFLFRGRQDEHRQAPQTGKPKAAAPAELEGLSVREGVRMRAFWIIAAANFAFVFYSIGLTPNLIPLLATKGATLQQAAQIASIMGVVSLIARLSAGWLLDRFPANIVATIIFLLPVAGCALMLLDSPSYLILTLAVASFGATLGAEYDIVFYLTSRHFGLKSFGALLGAMLTAGAAAGIVAPIIAGGVYDLTGSYDWLLIALMLLMTASAVAMALIGKPKREWAGAAH